MEVILMLLMAAGIVYLVGGIVISIYRAVDTKKIIKRRNLYMEYYKEEHPEYVEFWEKIKNKEDKK